MGAVDAGRLVRSRLRTEGSAVVLLDGTARPAARHNGPVYVAAVGKAAGTMARAAAYTLGAEARGNAISPEGAGRDGGITRHVAGHPLPNAEGSAATGAVLEGVARSGPGTLILVLLSGGASAMLVRPAPGLTLEEKVAVTKRLLTCGASIDEINIVRKHLSAVKGGWLARHAAGRPVWGLVLSDVVGDDIGTIGSGPTAPDASTYADAWAVVARYELERRLPASVVEHLREGMAGRRMETPKHGDPCFGQVRNQIVGSNRIALHAAALCADSLGFAPVVCDEPLRGDTTEAATRFAKELIRRRDQARRPICVLAGGETTVRVQGAGKGGRNQEFALAAALVLDGEDGVDVLSAGTDGVDGPTDAAGAFANGRTVQEACARGVDPRAALATNDSYRFFEALGALFRPGPTGTNVMDVKIALVRPAALQPAGSV